MQGGERHPDLRLDWNSAALEQGHRQVGGPNYPFPRQRSLEERQFQILRRLEQSIHMSALVKDQVMNLEFTSSLMANLLLFAVGLHMYATKHTSAR